VQTLLKDLEEVDTHLLNYMFRYNEDIRIGEDLMAKECAVEHKKNVLDPTRREVAWEHSLNLRKRLDLASKTRMINKGRDMLKIQNLM